MSKRGAASMWVAAFALLAWVFVAGPSLAAESWNAHARGEAPAAHVGGGHFTRAGGAPHFSAAPRPAPHFAPAPHYAPARHFAPVPHFSAPLSHAPGNRGFGGPHFAPRPYRAPPGGAAHGFTPHAATPGRPVFHGSFAPQASSRRDFPPHIFSTAPEAPEDDHHGEHGGRFGDRHLGDHDRDEHHDHDHVRLGFEHDRDHDWHGGYWGGSYWPPVFWGASSVLFLTGLPGDVPAYWWDGVPYYYYDNGYYVWNPSQDGYVATAPPPALDSSDAAAASEQPPADTDDQLYAYPEKGQTPEQQAEDRSACEQWAAQQAVANGVPLVNDNQSPDYHRAMIACLTGRGYSVD